MGSGCNKNSVVLGLQAIDGHFPQKSVHGLQTPQLVGFSAITIGTVPLGTYPQEVIDGIDVFYWLVCLQPLVVNDFLLLVISVVNQHIVFLIHGIKICRIVLQLLQDKMMFNKK